MYHQFKQLGGHRHHEGADGDRADDALHDGRHPRRRRHADVDRARASSPRGECAAGMHGANRLGGNSLSDLLVFGKRAGEYAAEFAKEHGAGHDRRRRRSTRRARARSRRSSAARRRGRRTRCRSLQEMMQDHVGIVRRESEMQQALEGSSSSSSAPRTRRRAGQSRVQSWMAHRARPAAPAHRSEAITRCGARAQGEPRRTLPRRLSRQGSARSRRSTSSSSRARTARCSSTRGRSRRCPTSCRRSSRR